MKNTILKYFKKHSIFLFFFLLVITCKAVKKDDFSCDDKLYNYVLKVQFPNPIKKMPELCGYYKGKRLEFNGNVCIINESQLCNQFILVITEEVTHKSNKKKVKHLERSKNSPCRMFVITSQLDPEKNDKISWSVGEKKGSNIPVRLQDSSLILLMNPNHIDSINSSVTPSGQNIYLDTSNSLTNNTIIYLPDIIIKPNITQNEVNTASVYTLLASLDSNAIHPKSQKILKNERNLICMRTSNN